MTSEFDRFNLHPEIVQAIEEQGYITPTPIQSAVIPLMIKGQDVIGQAQTGTGKTAAFALPILHNIQPDQGCVQGFVVTPTRELALQVAGAFYDYGHHRNARTLAVFGGQPYERQIHRLKKGIDVVVGTPGRLLDLIRQNVLDLSNVKTVVLDEADEMLSMGFIEDIEAILGETPPDRQTALFSATMPSQIRNLASRYMHNPQQITIEHKQLTVDSLEQRYYLVNENEKMQALTRLFEVEPISSALIFAQTRIGTGDLANELTIRGFPAEALSGDLSQDARIRVLNRFRQNQIKVLVATDVAARGLDIDDISHVFNFDLPLDPEVYVHRVGRTGRVGKKGIAISLATPRDLHRLKRIEAFSRQPITRSTLPTIEDIRQHRENQLLEQVMMWLNRGRCKMEREIVEKLIANGYDSIDIATAALKMARAGEKTRPIEEITEVLVERPQGNQQERKRSNGQNGRNQRNGRRQTSSRDLKNESHEKGMVRLALSKGKQHGIRPNDVVGVIAFHGNIPGNSIGKILIGDNRTLVDIPEASVAQVMAKSGAFQIHKQTISIELAH